jgi:protein phosphatase
MTDSTEPKPANPFNADVEELRARVAMLQAILDNSSAVILVKDLEGRYTFVNRHYAEMRGLAANEILGKTIHDLRTKEEADVVWEHDQEVIRTRKPQRWEEHFTQEGMVITYVSSRFPMFDADGQLCGVCAVLTDISERKRAELELAAELESLRALVETSPMGVVIAEADGDRVVTVNREAERILGLPHRSGWTVQQYQDLFTRRHIDGHPFTEDEYPMFRALHDGQTVHAETIVYELAQGRSVRVVVNATPVYGDDGRISAAVATLQEAVEPRPPEAPSSPASPAQVQAIALEIHGCTVQLEYGFISERGLRRETNEDAVYCELVDSSFVSEAGWLCAVADGMGGSAVGEVASRLALDTLASTYYASLGGPDDLVGAVERANAVVYETAQQNPRYGGMGTTMTAALVRAGRLTVAHVGDSRAYLLRQGTIRQLTRDHTWVAELVRAGALDPNHRKNLPISSVLTRALGRASSIEVDIVEEELRADDGIVLCSDGLTNQVDDWEIARAAAAEGPHEAARSLVRLARARGGGDDITVTVVMLAGG